MEYADIYKCFCESLRLRILNLLIEGPLCVCHVHEILGEPQPKISRLLNQLKELGGVESVRHFNWTMYRLPEKPHPILAANIECLRNMRKEDPQLERDLANKDHIIAELAEEKKDCPLRPAKTGSGVEICCDTNLQSIEA